MQDFQWKTLQEIGAKAPIYFIGRDKIQEKKSTRIDKEYALVCHSTTAFKGSVEIYTKKEGWTKEELLEITSQDFINHMEKLPRPNTYLADALLRLETDQSLKIVEDYLKSLRIDADWDDRLSDEEYSNKLLIASLFFDYFWDKRLPSFRDDNKQIEKNLDRLIDIARRCDIKIAFEILSDLGDVGHDKVAEFAKEIAEKIDHKAYKSSALKYGRAALLRKKDGTLSQAEWDERYTETFTGGLLELLEWTMQD